MDSVAVGTMLATWFSGLTTLAVCIVSVVLARSRRKLNLYISCGLYSLGSDHENVNNQYLRIHIENIDALPIVVTGLFFSTPLFNIFGWNKYSDESMVEEFRSLPHILKSRNCKIFSLNSKDIISIFKLKFVRLSFIRILFMRFYVVDISGDSYSVPINSNIRSMLLYMQKIKPWQTAQS